MTTTSTRTNVLVTGGAGFIGSHLVERLAREGHSVTVFDSLEAGSASNVRPLLDAGAVRFVQGSVLDEPVVAAAMNGASLVFHLAALVGVRAVVERPRECIRVNYEGTSIVLRQAAARGAKVVLASSSEVAGKSPLARFAEDSDRVLGATTIPRWSYATAKALAEHLALAYSAEGLPMVALRYFNIYGPRSGSGGYANVIPKFITAALRGGPLVVHGDGRQTRCFTYVDDAVELTLRAAFERAANGGVLNVGSEDDTAIGALAELVRELTGSQSEVAYRSYEQEYGRGFEDVPHRAPDMAKARALFGFAPGVPLREGLARTIAWFRTDRQA